MKLILPLIFILLTSCATKKEEKDTKLKKAEIYYNHGTQSLLAKNYTKALKHLTEASVLNPSSSKIHNNLGMAFYYKKKFSRAIRHLKKSIKLDVKNTEARLNLATVYMNRNRFKEAQMQYEMVLNDLTFEGQFRTYYNLGILNLKQNNKFKAINYFKQALDESKDYCPAHFQLGNIYFQNGNYKKALKSFKNASKGACYDSPRPHYHQALSYVRLKEYNTAQLKLNEIIERFSDKANYQSLANKKLKEIKKLKRLDSRYNFDQDLEGGNILTPDF